MHTHIVLCICLHWSFSTKWYLYPHCLNLLWNTLLKGTKKSQGLHERLLDLLYIGWFTHAFLGAFWFTWATARQVDRSPSRTGGCIRANNGLRVASFAFAYQYKGTSCKLMRYTDKINGELKKKTVAPIGNPTWIASLHVWRREVDWDAASATNCVQSRIQDWQVS